MVERGRTHRGGSRPEELPAGLLHLLTTDADGLGDRLRAGQGTGIHRRAR
jgi:hypothetical protein